MKQFMKKVLGKRNICGALAILLVVSTVVNPLSMLPAYATGDWLQLSYQYNEKSDLELYVQAESENFEPGEEVVLDLFVQNNSEQDLTGRGLSLQKGKNAFSDYEFVLLDEGEEGAPEINENGNVVNLNLGAGEIYALQFVGTLEDDLEALNEKTISFFYGAAYPDETTVTVTTDFQFTVGLVDDLSVDIEDAELVAGETDILEIQMVLADLGYYYETSDDSDVETASDSDADEESDSNAETASDSDAEEASDSDADEEDDEEDYTFEINNIKFKLDTYGVKFENVTLLEATATASNAVINATVEYNVAEDTTAGAYFGTLGVEVKSGRKTYDVESGFWFTVVAAAEAGTVKHLDTCGEGCTSEGCDCECHAKAREIIAKVESLLAEAQTFTEDTDYEVMYAVYDALFALPDEMDAAWDNGELTEAEYYYVQNIVNTNAVTIIELLTAVGFDPYAIMLLPSNHTIAIGAVDTLDGSTGSNHSWTQTSGDGGEIAFNNSNTNTKRVSIMGISKGTVTVTHAYNRYPGSGNLKTETFTVKVTPAEDTIKVYVYVAGKDSEGNSWLNNAEFLDLIGLKVCDANGYFPAGEIELNPSFLKGKTNANTPGAALLTSEADWVALLAALSEMDTSTLVNYGGNFSQNLKNNVKEYLNQATQDLNCVWGSQKSALFRWNEYENNPSYGFNDQTVKFHLDLNFKTNKIKFITGNNGITSEISAAAADGTTVDERVYITGSIIQSPRNLSIPAGYKFVGYYEDAKFTIPWDGIGTPLNEDEDVYIKITPLDNVIIYYVNVTGPNAGSLSSDSEGLNPVTGVAKGSTATAKEGYNFVGWYADEACTKLLSTDATYVPTKTDINADAEKWVNGTTYYAKFEPALQTVIIEKEVTGDMGDYTREFTFILTGTSLPSKKDAGDGTYTYNSETLAEIILKHGERVELSIPVGTVITVKEEDYSDIGYTTTYSIDGENNESNKAIVKVDSEASVTIKFTNNKEATPDTGITMDSIPYILILVAVIGGIAFYVIRKRKETDLD